MQGADRADDPLVLASVARAGTHALLAVGLYEDARQLAGPLRVGAPRAWTTDDAAALSLMGMLTLRMARAAARHSRPGSTGTSTREATSTCPGITRG